MQIYSGTSVKLYFVAVDDTDFTTRETGIGTISFTVYNSHNGGSSSSQSVSITEVDSVNMPGVYHLSWTAPTITAGADFEEGVLHITASGMAPVTRAYTLSRPKITAGDTIDDSTIADAVWDEETTLHTSNTSSFGYHVDSMHTQQAANTLTLGSILSDTDDIQQNYLNTAGVQNAIWSGSAASHNTAGTFGHILNNQDANIADAVWTETVSDHSGTVGSTAESLSDAAAASSLTLSGIADAVWDETISGHTVAGSFGKGFKQVKEGIVSTESTVSDASPTTTGFVTGLTQAADDFYNDKILVFIDGALAGQSVVIQDYNGTNKSVTFDEPLTSAPANGDSFIILAIHAHPITEIKTQVADQVWEETLADHSGTTGSTAEALTSVGATPAQIADAVWTETLSDHSATSGSTAEKLSGITVPTVGQIADAVWDEDITTHVISNSAGLVMGDVSDAGSIAAAVWDENVVGHTIAGTFGEELVGKPSAATIASTVWGTTVTGNNNAGTMGERLDTVPTADQNATAVWGASVTGNTNSGTTGEAVLVNNTPPTVGDIADGVWDELTSGHSLAGTFGLLIQTINNSVPSEADIYTHFTSGSNADAFKANLSTLNDPSAIDIYTHFTASTNADAFKADVSSLATAASITALNDPSAADIADSVWDELLSGHTISGSSGEALANIASTAPTAAEIYTHFTTGSNADAFKADVSALATAASITALNDPSDAEIYNYFTALNNADAFKADVSSLATAASITALNDPTAAAIADAVWTETLADHSGTVGSTAESLAEHAAAAPTAAQIYTEFTTGSNADAFKADVSSLATAASITALNDPSAADIADAVWDEPQNDHIQAGTFGITANEIAIIDNKLNIVDAVVDTILIDTNELQQNQGDWLTATGFSTHSAADVADAVWTELLADHSAVVGSMAEALDTLASGGAAPTAAQIADAVWTETLADHSSLAGSTAEKLSQVATSTNIASAVRIEMDTNSSRLTAILDDTQNSLPAQITQTESDILTAIGALNDFDPATDTVARVTLVDTTTTLTNAITGAGTATIENQETLAQLIQGLHDFDPVNDTVTNVTNVTNVQNILGQNGSGAIEHNVCVKSGGAPLAGVDVWITTDVTGNNVVAGTVQTDATGSVKVLLDPGTYYQWVQLAGYNFSNPTSITVE